MNTPQQYPDDPVHSLTVPEQPGGLVPVAQQPGERALAAQVAANVQARYLMAMHRPRSMERVRTTLLHECRRPQFAALARYRKPVGRGVEGPTIRFAEAAARALGNLVPEASVVFDDDDRRVLRVSVTDLETNLTFQQDLTLRKVVERSKPRDGQEVLATREGSHGKTVYVVRASDDEFMIREMANVSKILRTLILRCLPRDILDECMDTAINTLRSRDAQDPDAAKRNILDAFHGLGIEPPEIEKYLGHPISQMHPDELAELREVFSAVRSHEMAWWEALAHKEQQRGDSPAEKETKGTAGLKAALTEGGKE